MGINSEHIKPAVVLSILSAPSRLSAWNLQDFLPDEICRKINISRINSQKIIALKYPGNPAAAADLIIGTCVKKNIGIITIWDDYYPPLLKQIYNPPLVLYFIGKIPRSEMVSIVGTRNSDPVSEQITKKIASALSLAGFIIVSGMAAGIDRCAHMGALLTKKNTVAVLPGGVDIIYPFKNADIYRMISETGSIVSEYPPGTGSSHKWTFVRRNRIISGLSRAVIVTQAPLKSGAMITARYALEQNRDLFACPGNAFDEKYSGCNELIRQGAIIMSELNDFFSEIDPAYSTGKKMFTSEHESQDINTDLMTGIAKHDIVIPACITGQLEISILKELSKGEIVIDNYIRANNLLIDKVNQAITMLEIEGLIIKKGNKISRAD